MLSGHGEYHPFCDVDGMVAYPFQIFGDHQYIKHIFAVRAVGSDSIYQIVFDADEEVIHLVITDYNIFRDADVFFYE